MDNPKFQKKTNGSQTAFSEFLLFEELSNEVCTAKDDIIQQAREDEDEQQRLAKRCKASKLITKTL